MVGLSRNLVELFLLASSIYVYKDLAVALFFTELKPVFGSKIGECIISS